MGGIKTAKIARPGGGGRGTVGNGREKGQMSGSTVINAIIDSIIKPKRSRKEKGLILLPH